jgi:DNA-binding SARP family transcriptional activator
MPDMRDHTSSVPADPPAHGLEVHLFGGVEIYRDGALLPAFPTQRSLSLFAYLVMQRGQPVHRDTVCERFWGEQRDAEARKALRTCLWRVRSVLEPGEAERGTILQANGSHLRFAERADTWVDAWEFEDAVRWPAQQNPDAALLARLDRAAALYQGELMEGLGDEWCAWHRERLRLAYLGALERLIGHHHASRQWQDVIAVGQRILHEDPLREHVHRAIMVSHLTLGDRASAMRQYHACVQTLRDELDIEPMGETRDLYTRIRQNPRDPLPEAGLPDHQLRALVHDLDDALAALHSLTRRLESVRAALTPTHALTGFGRRST